MILSVQRTVRLSGSINKVHSSVTLCSLTGCCGYSCVYPLKFQNTDATCCHTFAKTHINNQKHFFYFLDWKKPLRKLQLTLIRMELGRHISSLFPAVPYQSFFFALCYVENHADTRVTQMSVIIQVKVSGSDFSLAGVRWSLALLQMRHDNIYRLKPR